MRFIGARSPQGSFLPLPQLQQLFPAHHTPTTYQPSISSESLRCQQQEPSILLLLPVLPSMVFARCVCLRKCSQATSPQAPLGGGVTLSLSAILSRPQKYDIRKKHEHTVSRCGQTYIWRGSWIKDGWWRE